MTVTSVGAAAPGFPLSGAALGTNPDELVLVSRNLAPTRLAIINLTTWELDRTVTVPVGDGAFGTTTAADGVYVALYGAMGDANIQRLVDDIAQPRALLGTQFLWDLASDDGDRVYGVSTGKSLVFTIDRATGKATDIGVLPSRAHRPRTCALVGDRLVVGGSISGQAWLRHSDRNGRGGVDAVPSAIADDDLVYCSAAVGSGRVALGTGGERLDRPAVVVMDLDAPEDALVVRLPREGVVDTIVVDGDQVFATARPSGALYRVDQADGSLARLAVPVPMSETREIFLRGTSIVGASADGSVWEYDRSTDVTVRHTPGELGLVNRPQRAQSLLAAADRTDVGGSFTVTRHDLDSGVATTRFVPGEAKAMVEVDDRTFFAMYPIAEIWSWGADDDGPKRLTQLPSDQLRPIDLAYSQQLDALVVTTTDDRAHSALHLVDPITGRVDTIFDPLGLGQIASGLHVVGTTCYVGGSGNTAVGAFDLVSGEKQWQVDDAVPGGSFGLGLAVARGDLIMSTANGTVVRLDLATPQVMARRQVAESAGRMAVSGNDILLVTGQQLLQINAVNLRATVLEDDLAAEVWGWPPIAVDPSGRTWMIKGRMLVHT